MEWEVDLLLNEPDPWHMDSDEIRERKFAAIKQSFEHHYHNCEIYSNFCKGRKFSPADLKRYDDMVGIPLFSTRAFKEGLSLTSVPRDRIVNMFHSSGTSGTQSRVPRDELTMERFRKSLKQAILKVQGETAYVALMGPSPDELGDLAFANWARIGSELAQESEFFFKNLAFDPAYAVSKINATELRPVQIGGAPVLIMALADHILKTGDRIRTLTEESRITSGGGFKTFKGEQISREQYDEKLMAAFGIPKGNIRDFYAMTEINGMMSECAENLKHVPPWLHVSVRNPARLEEEVPFGEEGMPGFLDPCAHSYPGFVIADDIVRLAVPEGGICRCGRVGPCLDSKIRRAEGAESRGCGRHIDELRSGAV
jgi:long-chain-fatty-acid---luciferin-component ligase